MERANLTSKQRYRRKAKARLSQKEIYARWYAENRLHEIERVTMWNGMHAEHRRAYKAAWVRNRRYAALGLKKRFPVPVLCKPVRDTEFRSNASLRERVRRWAWLYNPDTLRLMA